MDNSQNTIAGTNNGAPIVVTNGNPFLDALSSLSDVAFSGLNTYGTFKEKLQALDILNEDKLSKPEQTVPPELQNSPAGVYSDPAGVQRILMYTGIGVLLLIGTIFVVKKL